MSFQLDSIKKNQGEVGACGEIGFCISFLEIWIVLFKRLFHTLLDAALSSASLFHPVTCKSGINRPPDWRKGLERGKLTGTAAAWWLSWWSLWHLLQRRKQGLCVLPLARSWRSSTRCWCLFMHGTSAHFLFPGGFKFPSDSPSEVSGDVGTYTLTYRNNLTVCSLRNAASNFT